MRITLLGLEFASANLGCAALAYSFVNELGRISKEMGIKVQYSAVVFAKQDDIKVPCTGQNIECLKIRYKSISFWKNLMKLFKDSDLIVDFTGGDSFSDIYGIKRFYMATFIKKLALYSKTSFMLGPQTYGPYQRKMVKKWAKSVISKSTYVFARDEVSRKFAASLSGKKIESAPDVAFALPYEKKEKEKNPEKIKVGINVSGLLWNGGYSHAKLPLTVDYRIYCQKLIEKLQKEGKYEIHLITHVGKKGENVAESDYNACLMLHKEYPDTILAEMFSSPMEAKSYIAGMDILIAARMHATIAAFSTDTATIPFSYSRKFEGLYDSVGYDYVIHACTQSTKEALGTTLSYIRDYKNLEDKVSQSMKCVEEKKETFAKRLKEILEKENPV